MDGPSSLQLDFMSHCNALISRQLASRKYCKLRDAGIRELSSEKCMGAKMGPFLRAIVKEIFNH